MKKVLAIMIILVLATAAFADSIFSMRAAGAFDFITYRTPKSSTDIPEYTLSFDNTQVTTPGLGFDVGADLKLSNTLVLYGDFSMAFPAKISVGSDKYSKNDEQGMLDFYTDAAEKGEIVGAGGAKFKNIDGKAFLTTVSAHLGFAKLIDMGDHPFNLTLGGGVGYTRTSSGFRMTMNKVESDGKLYHLDNYEVYSDLSLDMYINAQYKFAEHFSVGATLMPGFVFFSSSKQYATLFSDTDNKKYPSPVSSEDYYKTDGLASGVTPKYENSGFCAGFSLNTAIGITYHF